MSETEQLLTVLRQEARRRKPAVRLQLLLAWIAVTAMVALTFLANDGRDWLQGVILLASLSGLGLFISRAVASRAQKRAVRRLAAIESIRALPMLIDALAWPEAVIHRPIRNALTRMLPQLNERGMSLLTTSHLGILCRALGTRDVELTIAILGLLERIGGAEAIPYVQRLSTGALLDAGESQIRAAANHCYFVLQSRAGSDEQTLLRAADAAPGSSTLLQPATGGASDDARNLVRAAGNE